MYHSARVVIAALCCSALAGCFGINDGSGANAPLADAGLVQTAPAPTPDPAPASTAAPAATPTPP
ncbi:MAG: hypothetical protein ABI616_08760, partial [Pseudomonadota bacterium]